MTPDERLELEACLRRAAEILYANSDPDSLETLEDLEKKVREQVLTEVSPRILFFCRKEDGNKEREKKKTPKSVRDVNAHVQTGGTSRARSL